MTSPGAAKGPPGPVEWGLLRDLVDRLGVDLDLLVAVAQGEIRAELALHDDALGTCWFDTLASWRSHRDEVTAAGGAAAWQAIDDARLRAQRDRYLTERPPAKSDTATYVVYRLYGADDRLLYVGSTRNLTGRLVAHRKRWPGLIARVEHDVFETAASMLDVESSLIRDLCPPLNHAEVGA